MRAEGRDVGGQRLGGRLTASAKLHFWAESQVEEARLVPWDRAVRKREPSLAGTELEPLSRAPLTKVLLGQPASGALVNV